MTVREILSPLAQAFSLGSLISLSGQRLIFPSYHLVNDHTPVHIKHIYPAIGEDMFRKHLDFFLKNYQALTLDDVRGIANGNRWSENGFFLTFDDGLRECFDIIAPILKEKGIPAALFLNPDFVDNKDLFYRYKASILLEDLIQNPPSPKQIEDMLGILRDKKLPSQDISTAIFNISYKNRSILDELADIKQVRYQDYLSRQQPYMSTAQIKDLKEQGFYLGAHTSDHPDFSDLTEPEQLKEALNSLRFVKDRFKVTESLFAFPFTDYGVSRSFFQQLYEEAPGIMSFGGAGLKKDSFPQHIQRIPMEGSGNSAENLIKTEYLYYLLKMPIGKNTIHRI